MAELTSFSNRLVFSGHESFQLRYAWLPKVAQELEVDTRLFGRDDALVRLGVGKNMVDSIRFWATAMEFITASVDGHALTPLAEKLLGQRGWDPYLEATASLWILQWQLTRRPDRASTWHYAFTRWNRPVFTRDELVNWLLSVVRQTGTSRASRASLQRDVDVFLRTYLPHGEKSKRPVEDSFDSPLAQLGLIVEIEHDLYALSRGTQPTLSPSVLAYTVLDYWSLHAHTQETLSFERLLHGQGSPGGAFQLSEPALVHLLERLPRDTGLRYDESAGMRRVIRSPSRSAAEPMNVLASAFRAGTKV
jgi:hypothetical protein